MKNIGKHIKTLATILLVANCILAFILACVFEKAGGGVILLCLVGIPLASVINFFLTYGFGELIETNQQIVRSLERNAVAGGKKASVAVDELPEL